MNKKKLFKALISIIPDALAVTGALLVWLGIDKIYRPAGLVTAGILLITGAVIWSKGGGGQ